MITVNLTQRQADLLLTAVTEGLERAKAPPVIQRLRSIVAQLQHIAAGLSMTPYEIEFGVGALVFTLGRDWPSESACSHPDEDYENVVALIQLLVHALAERAQ